MDRFETLVYTDCRPGEGLTGGAGLQFQARSSDAAAPAQTLVKDRLLYEPPARWMADRRPAGEYPPSFGHLSASGYLATASGVYLGREANGVREGNQLTHAIVATGPEAYRGLRPAQLYGASFWTTTPAPGSRSAPVTVSPEDVPYTPARARKFVLSRRNGAAMLFALVSALERAGSDGRVLFLGDDVGDIVEWLVAGTLLVPRSRALELGFKVYSNDPARSPAPVVAVHPDFAGPATHVDNQLGYLVFDLTTHRHSPVGVSDSAERWVRLFLDGDPRDAVDALDVAGESGIDDDAAAAALGRAAILHAEPPAEHAETIVGWLRRGPRRLRDAYGADLTDLFAEMPERWSRDVLRLLDEVGSDGLLPGKAAEVRIALLLKDIEEAVTGGPVTSEPPAPLPAGEWGPDRDDQALALLLEALQAPGRSGHAIEALLRVAHRYRAAVHPAHLGEASAELARHLSRDPRLLRPAEWPHGAETEDLVIAALRARAARGGPEPALIGDMWGPWLLRHRSKLPRELRAAALGAAVRAGDDRTGLLRDELSTVLDDPDRYARRVTDLFSQTTPYPDEIRLIAENAPPGTPPIDRVFRAVTEPVAGPGPATARQLRLCHDLRRRGLIAPNRALETTLAADETLTGALDRLPGAPGDRVSGLLTDIAESPPKLVRARSDRIRAALLDLPVFRSGDRVFDRHPELLDPYLNDLADTLRTSTRAALAVMAFQLEGNRLRDDKNRKAALGKAVDHWLTWAPDRHVAEAGRQVADVLGRKWTEAWDNRVERLAGRRKRYRITHPFGGGRS
ncbi:GTPase-associated protein 1-related protein [Actinoplanes sp. NPDC049802]|uniref:GTPase-associated protein 1-related protein n=1 Tax=Actinoplanes sp. NPDC049802 TaxID=3154742 RepID=UPI0033DC2CC4